MPDSLKRLMYISAALDMIPWILFGFTGVYTRIYIARNVDVDLFAVSGMVETMLGVTILQALSSKKVIHAICRNIVLISFCGSIFDIVRALLIIDYPGVSLILGSISSTVFFTVIWYGFREMANTLYAGTDRTLYSVIGEKFGKIGNLVAMVSAFILKELPITTVVTILVVSNAVVFCTDCIQYWFFKKELIKYNRRKENEYQKQ